MSLLKKIAEVTFVTLPLSVPVAGITLEVLTSQRVVEQVIPSSILKKYGK